MYAQTSFFVAVADADARGVLAALGHYMTACMYVLCTSYEVRRYEYGAARGMWDAPGEKCASARSLGVGLQIAKEACACAEQTELNLNE